MRKKREELSKTQKKILECIAKQINSKGYSPSYREIAARIGISSTSTIHMHLQTLERKGYIVKNPFSPRTIELTDKAVAMFPGHSRNTVMVPLVGAVAAGLPITAEEHVEEYIPMPAQVGKMRSPFMLRVKGESMVDAGIRSGDMILVEKEDSASNGEMVVAMTDGEATVKTFYKEDGHVRLQPANSTMEPIILDDVSVIGKVRGVLRFF